MPRFYMLALMYVLALTSSAPRSRAGSTDIAIPIINAGAETGDLAGWTVMGNADWQASNAQPAAQGDWYFETDALWDDERLVQLIDVRSLTGLIERIQFSASMAVDRGAAEYDPSGSEYYRADWWGDYRLNLFDSEGNPLGGQSRSVLGTSPAVWRVRTVDTNGFFDFESYRESIAYIEILLGGSWDGEYVGWIYDLPEFTRFDDLALTVTVPEPASLALVLLGGAALLRRRK